MTMHWPWPPGKYIFETAVIVDDDGQIKVAAKTEDGEFLVTASGSSWDFMFVHPACEKAINLRFSRMR